jgi:hypothetical protein
MSLSTSKYHSPVHDRVTPDESKARVSLPSAYQWVPLDGVMNVNRVSPHSHGLLKPDRFATDAFKSICLLELICAKQSMAMTDERECRIAAVEVDDADDSVAIRRS